MKHGTILENKKEERCRAVNARRGIQKNSRLISLKLNAKGDL